MKYANWTNRKIQRLLECYPTMSGADLLIEFAPHTIGAICRAARRNGARRAKKPVPASKRRDWAAIARAHKPMIFSSNRVQINKLTENATNDGTWTAA